MNKKRFLFILLALIGIVGAILSAILFVSAMLFGELGRVILYLVTTIVCVEMTVLAAMRAFPRKEQ